MNWTQLADLEVKERRAQMSSFRSKRRPKVAKSRTTARFDAERHGSPNASGSLITLLEPTHFSKSCGNGFMGHDLSPQRLTIICNFSCLSSEPREADEGVSDRRCRVRNHRFPRDLRKMCFLNIVEEGLGFQSVHCTWSSVHFVGSLWLMRKRLHS